jgi:hypothetical protein
MNNCEKKFLSLDGGGLGWERLTGLSLPHYTIKGGGTNPGTINGLDYYATARDLSTLILPGCLSFLRA